MIRIIVSKPQMFISALFQLGEVTYLSMSKLSITMNEYFIFLTEFSITMSAYSLGANSIGQSAERRPVRTRGVLAQVHW